MSYFLEPKMFQNVTFLVKNIDKKNYNVLIINILCKKY